MTLWVSNSGWPQLGGSDIGWAASQVSGELQATWVALLLGVSQLSPGLTRVTGHVIPQIPALSWGFALGCRGQVRHMSPWLYFICQSKLLGQSRLTGQGNRFHLLLEMSWIKEEGAGKMIPFSQVVCHTFLVENWAGNHLRDGQWAITAEVWANADCMGDEIPTGSWTTVIFKVLKDWGST